ncbi:Outer membrane protein assembly factor BamE, lipoprotein component of the BamABCDE complex [Cnuella takakiae]|uniref:Outer membrane protein assembly factor BamE, lipoprotein component of the BamABCDE complex n=1 Tax=Cnuella takakiae TaxID=1302690 RepID=A0A1M5ITI7_9BACT|nr:hypothetical protein [Cnuella takakiae]OLY93977.1 hypothetical protein BUE76_20395 [Cnuella takakiae]SHG31339.1 Outer membrane protein assembly factor BamE, lipoprotein component of the BamABCDE complex [Cnuella takakiae]
MKLLQNLLILTALASCTAAKVSVPSQFEKEATRMAVKGLNGWMINQQLSFGNYHTSAIKRGWDFTSSVQYTRFGLRPEEMLMRVIHIDTDKRNLSQRNKFQYTLSDGKNITEIYATEKFRENDLVYKSNNPFLGDVSRTRRYEYAFTAAILPISQKDPQPWSLVLVNRYDANKDTARKLFDRPFVEEEGYATNGKDNVAIRPLRLEEMKSKKGKPMKVFGGPLLAGYELRMDDGVVGIIDILDNAVWLYNDLEAPDKLLLSSIASAIMLKRMQDVAKDRDNIPTGSN